MSNKASTTPVAYSPVGSFGQGVRLPLISTSKARCEAASHLAFLLIDLLFTTQARNIERMFLRRLHDGDSVEIGETEFLFGTYTSWIKDTADSSGIAQRSTHSSKHSTEDSFSRTKFKNAVSFVSRRVV